jgi:hypothetical protein
MIDSIHLQIRCSKALLSSKTVTTYFLSITISSDALFFRRNNLFPRLILNKAEAYTTDTMHRVFIKEKTNKNAFVASFYNSLSLAFSEIVGRSYGGGVLVLMPSETENSFPLSFGE